MFYYCLGLFVCVQNGFAIKYDKYLNLRCKDNGNEPVDWWIIYKPPISASPQYFSRGGRFTFLIDGQVRWQKSGTTIHSNSMLQYTLAPLAKDQRDKVAWLVADETDVTSSNVVMMADQASGVFLEHSLPQFPNLDAASIQFPDAELKNGHYLMCLSLDVSTLNILASVLREIKSEVQTNLPLHLESALPLWKCFAVNNMNSMRFDSDAMDFMTKDNSLPVHIMLRRPKDRRCLYMRFAEKKKVVIDVYGHDRRCKSFCTVDYGVRQQNKVSLKYQDEVHYIPNVFQKMSFGVTTAAAWQKTGSEPNQYWACLSTLERVDSTFKSGLLICLKSYSVWWSFDNLKVKEPECYVGLRFLKPLVSNYL